MVHGLCLGIGTVEETMSASFKLINEYGATPFGSFLCNYNFPNSNFANPC